MKKLLILWYNILRKISGYLKSNLDFISGILKDIAQVALAALVFETFTKETVNWTRIIIGMIVAIVFWISGIISNNQRNKI